MPSLVDWSKDPSTFDPVALANAANVDDQTSEDEFNNGIDRLGNLEDVVDPTGAAVAGGVVQFDEVNQLVAELKGLWADANGDHLQHFMLGDRAEWEADRMTAYYLNANGSVKSQFTITNAALGATRRAAGAIGAIGERAATGVGAGLGLALVVVAVVYFSGKQK